MPQMKLTAAAVEKLKPPEKPLKQIDYWDKDLHCFGLRISYGGTKTWVITSRVMREGEWTKPQRMAIGRYPAMSLAEARERAKTALADARAGKDPALIAQQALAEAVDASRNTFDVLADRFLKEEGPKLRKSTQVAYRHALKGPKVAELKSRPVAQITKQDIRQVIKAIDAPYAANRTLAYLKRFFAWCVEELDLSIDPAKTLKKSWKEAARERALSPTEIRDLWPAMAAEASPYGPCFQLALLTAQRRGEVSGMRWSELRGLEFNRDGKLVETVGQEPAWEIPGERTKNGRTQWVPLAPQAVAILKKCPRVSKDLVFPSGTGETPISSFSDAKQRIEAFVTGARAKAGITKQMPSWHLHDFRTTASTWMHENGIAPHVVEAVLNHVSGHKAGVAGVYNRAEYRVPKRQALEAWANFIFNSQPKNIVPLHQRRSS